MRTKLQLLIIACLTIFSLNAIAQTKSVEEAAKDLTDKMTKALTLSQDQVSKIQTINEDYVRSVRGISNLHTSNKAEWEKQTKEINQQREVDSRKIFNENQYNTYLKRKTEWEVKK